MGLLARQTINCERIGRGGGGARNITVLIFHPASTGAHFAPVFNITPRGGECFNLLLLLPLSPHQATFGKRYRVRNEFTILIWRAALAIYYLRGGGGVSIGGNGK